MNKNSLQIKRLVGLATLTAIVVVLQLISNNITLPGGISITLALIPVAMGAILYGPVAGFILGAILGVIVITAQSTMTTFMPVSPVATIFVCILKTGLAGLASGFVFKGINAIKTKNTKVSITKFSIAIIAAALVVPVINTGLFIIFGGIFFQSVFGATGAGNGIAAVFAAVMTTNFLLEFLLTTFLSPALAFLIKVLTRNYDLGFNIKLDFNEDADNNELDIL